VIGALNVEGQSFAQVAEDQFEFRLFIEQAAAHHTQRVRGSFDRESPGRAKEQWVSPLVPERKVPLPYLRKSCSSLVSLTEAINDRKSSVISEKFS
jgi:hypothetical protein